MGEYRVIGNMVTIGRTGKTFGGPVVASGEAIYVIVQRDSAQEQLNSGYRGVARGMSVRTGWSSPFL